MFGCSRGPSSLWTAARFALGNGVKETMLVANLMGATSADRKNTSSVWKLSEEPAQLGFLSVFDSEEG